MGALAKWKRGSLQNFYCASPILARASIVRRSSKRAKSEETGLYRSTFVKNYGGLKNS